MELPFLTDYFFYGSDSGGKESSTEAAADNTKYALFHIILLKLESSLPINISPFMCVTF